MQVAAWACVALDGMAHARLGAAAAAAVAVVAVVVVAAAASFCAKERCLTAQSGMAAQGRIFDLDSVVTRPEVTVCPFCLYLSLRSVIKRTIAAARGIFSLQLCCLAAA